MQASALSKALGQSKVKPYKQENNLKNGKPIFACWAYRRNYHTYESKTVNKQKVMVCRCGEIYIETPKKLPSFTKVKA